MNQQIYLLAAIRPALILTISDLWWASKLDDQCTLCKWKEDAGSINTSVSVCSTRELKDCRCNPHTYTTVILWNSRRPKGKFMNVWEAQSRRQWVCEKAFGLYTITSSLPVPPKKLSRARMIPSHAHMDSDTQSHTLPLDCTVSVFQLQFDSSSLRPSHLILMNKNCNQCRANNKSSDCTGVRCLAVLLHLLLQSGWRRRFLFFLQSLFNRIMLTDALHDYPFIPLYVPPLSCQKKVLKHSGCGYWKCEKKSSL